MSVVIEDDKELSALMWKVYDHVRDGGGVMYEGGASVAEATYLRNIAESSKSLSIAEIGFNVGFSSIAFLESSPDSTVVSFELDRRRGVELAKDFVDARYPGRHEMIIGSSLDTVPEFAGTRDDKFDLLFVDGGHDYEIAAADIRNVIKIAKSGAIVIVDDLTPWFPWGAGPAQAWYEAVDLGLIEPFEYYVDGKQVDAIVPPGDGQEVPGRAWAAGRFLTAG
jgi:predicted O-methyltransferase YrrM